MICHRLFDLYNEGQENKNNNLWHVRALFVCLFARTFTIYFKIYINFDLFQGHKVRVQAEDTPFFNFFLLEKGINNCKGA